MSTTTPDPWAPLPRDFYRRHPAEVAPDKVPAYAVPSPGSVESDGARGATVFARACAGCHGDDGRGGERDGRAIGAVHDAVFLTLCSDQVLRRYVITGRPDLGMPSFSDPVGRPAGFRPLAAQDVADLSALLASWRCCRRQPGTFFAAGTGVRAR